MNNDERIIEELKRLRKIEWSQNNTDMVWKRLEHQIREDCGNGDSLDSDAVINHSQLPQQTVGVTSFDQLSAKHQGPITMGVQRSNPNKDG